MCSRETCARVSPCLTLPGHFRFHPRAQCAAKRALSVFYRFSPLSFGAPLCIIKQGFPALCGRRFPRFFRQGADCGATLRDGAYLNF